MFATHFPHAAQQHHLQPDSTLASFVKRVCVVRQEVYVRGETLSLRTYEPEKKTHALHRRVSGRYIMVRAPALLETEHKASF